MAIKISNNTIIDDARRFINYREVVTTASVSGSYTVNLSTANVFDLTLTGNTTFTFSNPAAAGTMHSFTIILRQGSTAARTATWPASVRFSFGEVPVLASGTAGAYDVITFFTVNGGTRYAGAHALANVAP